LTERALVPRKQPELKAMRLLLQPTHNCGFPWSSETPRFAEVNANATKMEQRQNPNEYYRMFVPGLVNTGVTDDLSTTGCKFLQ